MKRAGFTMIELIFVIVILGILSAVALPKLVGVKEQADEGLVKGFVGTLNRSVGPAKWSASLMDGVNGSVDDGNYNITTTDTDFPTSFTITSLDLTNCGASDANNSTAAVGTTSDNKFSIVCRDGNASQAPRFWYTETNVSASYDDTKLKL